MQCHSSLDIPFSFNNLIAKEKSHSYKEWTVLTRYVSILSQKVALLGTGNEKSRLIIFPSEILCLEECQCVKCRALFGNNPDRIGIWKCLAFRREEKT